jgi:NADH-quinone oxidoreductase E subunit
MSDLKLKIDKSSGCCSSNASCCSPAVELSQQAVDRVRELASLYPNKKSAIMPALYIAQEELGSLNQAAFDWVGKQLDIPPAHVRSVATFYTMYYKQPVGRYHLQVCRTLSCMLCGSRNLVEYLKERFEVKSGEITSDGMWSFEEVECLGSCGTAPMIQINDVFFENLTPEKLDSLLKRIELEKPDLRYSTLRGELGEGLVDLPRSQAWDSNR